MCVCPWCVWCLIPRAVYFLLPSLSSSSHILLYHKYANGLHQFVLMSFYALFPPFHQRRLRNNNNRNKKPFIKRYFWLCVFCRCRTLPPRKPPVNPPAAHPIPVSAMLPRASESGNRAAQEPYANTQTRVLLGGKGYRARKERARGKSRHRKTPK